ncbi:MAG: DctP family TRAP transporter solute-binding subunit [Tissierellia bacterium]|nr:DctP family TRAP transporter solute-binding subunit [Tissierellia bacterium]
MKRLRNRFTTWSLILLLFVSLIGCNSNNGNDTSTNGTAEAPASAEKTVIKAAHVVTENDPYHLGLVRLKEIVEENTEGRYQIEIYPNGTLGSERDLVEGVQMGSIGMSVTATGPVGSFVSELSVIELPFLIRDYDHADKVLMGEIGEELSNKISVAANVKSLGFWENGFRSVVTRDKKIESVEDIKGLKIRTMENPVHMAAWTALGADPVPMAWGDAYTGVQQGALDGLENAISLLYSLKTSEITNYLTITEHVYSASSVLMNQKIWDGMSDADQQIFEDAFKEASAYEREVAREQSAEAEEKLVSEGLEVTHPNRDAFRELTKNVKDTLDGDFSDIISRIESQ